MSNQALAQFKFLSNPCNVAIQQLINSNTGQMFKELAITPNRDTILNMAYFYGEGLRLTNHGSIQTKNNILGEFLGIKKDDLNGFKSFFERYGFLFPLDNTNGYVGININEISKLQYKLMSFIKLINNQPSTKGQYHNVNFQELIDGILYLLFSENIKITLGNDIVFETCDNIFLQKLNNAITHDELVHGVSYEKINGQLIKVFHINDSFLSSKINTVEYEFFEEFINEHTDTPLWSKNLFRLYKNKNQFFAEDNEQFYRMATDFLYHFITESTLFDLEIITNEESFSKKIYEDFIINNTYKECIIEISKHLIAYEFQNNLYEVQPTYDIDSMKPSWTLPSLYCALYFSLFYLNHSETGLRKCANQNCNEYFQVSRTNSIKKHCCILCTNAVSQRKYQNKKRETE